MTPIPAPPALPAGLFPAVTARVNEWRGRCLDAFTRIETAATECLVAMAEVEGRGSHVWLPHMGGQRLEALAAAVGDGGAFAAEGKPVVAMLEHCRSHLPFRNMLCHGQAKVTVDANGRWLVLFRLTSLRAGQPHPDQLAMTEAEGDALAVRLARTSRDFCSRAGQARALIRPAARQGATVA